MKSAASQEKTEKALAAVRRQYRLYCIAKSAELKRLYADPVHGERLRKFSATLNHFDIGDGGRLVAWVATETHRWLGAAPLDVRHCAMELLSARIVRIRLRAGLPEFDDPLPDTPDDVRIICRREILGDPTLDQSPLG